MIGIFPEEEEAYTLVSLLIWLLPLLVVIGAGIDFSLFLLYQTKLHTWKELFAEPEPDLVVQETPVEEENFELDFLFIEV